MEQSAERNNSNREAFAAAKAFLDSHKRFFLASHARTDGDDLGSVLAIVEILKSMGKYAVPAAAGGVPPSLKFLPGQHAVAEKFPTKESFDAIILSGCSSPERTAMDEVIKSTLPILNIDHHPDNSLYGAVNVVDSTKSSVAELVYDFIKFLGQPITPEISKDLLTGIFTDTGSFIHANTSAETLKVAGELVEGGARTDSIHASTYTKDLSAMKAWAIAMENTKVDEKNKIVLSVLSDDDIQKIGMVNDDTFGGFVNFLQAVPNTRLAIFIYQDGEYVKGSIRSDTDRGFNVSKLAKFFGGGGHVLASGFRVKGKVTKTEKGWQIE
jgi:phosphoesterase RecJ-like protein